MFLAANALPLLGGSALAFLYYTGRITFKEAPPAMVHSAVATAVAILVLSLLCWILMPVVAGLRGAVQRSALGTRQRMRTGGAVMWLLRLPIWLVQELILIPLWAVSAATMLLILGNVLLALAMLLLLVRVAVTGGN